MVLFLCNFISEYNRTLPKGIPAGHDVPYLLSGNCFFTGATYHMRLF
ncbi:hypothetical protein BRYFOR_09097 [Marvinbryantia formatexigens DSM 14469]|uniref:Uncharacterized protein n=1 Tax=Marvinbryantia formatexigens DSM 14469 TaxID=478749 RepID=C6LKB0_9FIRM|nr:hypothetical protein BRYFOR_09097 [Marvinbryantia formatexigens DSM 14469]